MNSPTGRNVPPYRPPFHEFPRDEAPLLPRLRYQGTQHRSFYGGRLADHTLQLSRAIRELEDLQAQEIACWRMFGLEVREVQDEVLVVLT